MKAVIYHSYDDISIENRSIPSISAHGLLLRVHGCGLYGSGILKIAQKAAPPFVPGHELIGTIVERGRAVSQFEVGQRVVVAHQVPCGTCHYCRHGNYSMCSAFKASNIDPCGFAEYIRVPAQHVRHTTLPLPDTLGITSTYSSSPDELRVALDLLARGSVRVDHLISHRLPLARFAEGVALMRECAALKVYFHISGE